MQTFCNLHFFSHCFLHLEKTDDVADLSLVSQPCDTDYGLHYCEHDGTGTTKASSESASSFTKTLQSAVLYVIQK